MKILVIDDKAVNRESARLMLSEHEVTTVDSYDRAVDFIVERVTYTDVLRALGRPIGSYHVDDEFRTKEAELKPKFDFDVVFIDLMMPASNDTLGRNCEHRRGEQMPYGFPLMIDVAMRHAKRVKSIAIVSDINHHNHAMSAALDYLGGYVGGYVMMNGIYCFFIHAQLQEDGSKDWNDAFDRVISPNKNWN